MSCCEFCIYTNPLNSKSTRWHCTHASVLFSLIKVSILLKSGRSLQSSSQHIVISFNIWGFRSSNLLMSGLQDWPFWILLIISVIKRLAYKPCVHDIAFTVNYYYSLLMKLCPEIAAFLRILNSKIFNRYIFLNKLSFFYLSES